jgi:RNA polymerase primary sigma factor
LNRVSKEASRLEQKLERRPSSDEIAESLDIPEDKIADVLRISTKHVSVDAPLVQGEDISLLDVYMSGNDAGTDEHLIHESLSQEIQRSLSTLTEKERNVINLYYGLETKKSLSLDEIGQKYDLTRERVRQIKEKAIKRLKHSSRSKLLRSYLG